MRWTVFLLGMLLAQAYAAEVVEVRIRDYKFVPERVVVKAGTTVQWTNDEKRASHSVVFPAEKLESERLLNGDSWQRSFDRPAYTPTPASRTPR
jgi:plastocyanin